uniref:Uncharacterized protein n=1 Tax=Xiphophorus maculatus TaxID=8083 RepID=A0A3B5PYW5_XIPMA
MEEQTVWKMFIAFRGQTVRTRKLILRFSINFTKFQSDTALLPNYKIIAAFKYKRRQSGETRKKHTEKTKSSQITGFGSLALDLNDSNSQ